MSLGRGGCTPKKRKRVYPREKKVHTWKGKNECPEERGLTRPWGKSKPGVDGSFPQVLILEIIKDGVPSTPKGQGSRAAVKDKKKGKFQEDPRK